MQSQIWKQIWLSKTNKNESKRETLRNRVYLNYENNRALGKWITQLICLRSCLRSNKSSIKAQDTKISALNYPNINTDVKVII